LIKSRLDYFFNNFIDFNSVNNTTTLSVESNAGVKWNCNFMIMFSINIRSSKAHLRYCWKLIESIENLFDANGQKKIFLIIYFKAIKWCFTLYRYNKPLWWG